ncbi:OsmC family protein [Aliterella atlantica]|uniref:OsmC family protein n=1 Tax=Aliterella atlantica CENA595 TaxID=1618023 RepID=A0A0D8ZLR7_9CYAN|nr:OsmC family protein [Aliterella atlantica]KJH69337.1 OsmC family protein [Aliterella atlantica CENA595]
MPTARIIYTGDLRTEATHLQSGTKIGTDAPTDNHGKGEQFSPTDLTATSLGTCIITTMGIRLRAEGLDFTGTELAVTKIMTPQPPRRIARIEVQVHMRTNVELTDEQRQKCEEIAQSCPVALTLHPDVEQAVTFHWN